MFRADPRVRRIPLGQTSVCVIDDALEDPQRWVDLAAAHADSFVEAPRNAYPGIELPMPDSIAAQCMAYIDHHIAADFGLKGCANGHAKLAIATYPAHALQPFQVIPHVDSLRLAPGQVAMAMVLYLFEDAGLGGTSFYRPRMEPTRLAGLFEDAARMPIDAFSTTHGIARAYPADGNAWFERVLTVPPRRNRLIVYPGTVFHCSDIQDPARLQPNPATGRLTLNGFFACVRARA